VAEPASPEPAAAETSPGAPAAAPAVAPESSGDGANPAAAASAPLVLSYRSPSWTEVRDRSGQLLISRLVDAGSEQRIGGTPPFDIVIGNAPGVVLVYRGKPIDLTRYTRQNVARLRLP
jgi:cytoskeleton protein RodZ